MKGILVRDSMLLRRQMGRWKKTQDTYTEGPMSLWILENPLVLVISLVCTYIQRLSEKFHNGKVSVFHSLCESSQCRAEMAHNVSCLYPTNEVKDANRKKCITAGLTVKSILCGIKVSQKCVSSGKKIYENSQCAIVTSISAILEQNGFHMITVTLNII